jgi:uncharacterized protein (UPF0548 family)
MPSLFKPTATALRRTLASQSALEFTYPNVGATALLPLPLDKGRGEGTSAPRSTFSLPPSYTIDHTRIDLGRGQEVFDRAKAALARWQQFQLGWLEAFPSDTSLRAGETVLVIARAGGLWWSNAARIVYTIDTAIEESVGNASDGTTIARFGFAYGTLPQHVESGEERFLIEWDHATGTVHFDILAFSRPRHLLVRLNRRRARAMQRRFAAEASAAMKRAASAVG